MQDAQQDYLDDILAEDMAFKIVRADIGKRFLNYLIDLASFYAMFFILGIVLALVSQSLLAGVVGILNPIVSMLLFGLYMGIIEAVTKGRSLGKFITGTMAVNEDGSTISAYTAFARGFCRVVPFDQLSALRDPPNPWHDKWNSTHVIDIRKSNYGREGEG